MRAITKFLGATALAAFTLSVTAAFPDDEKKGAAKLEGTYTIVSGEKDGKAIPVEEIKGSVVHFGKDRITGTDKNKKEFFAATYTLDTSKTPWRIDMKSTTPKEAEAVGLVKAGKDTVTLIYALPGAPAPTDFKTVKGQNLFVMKRQEEKK